MKTSLTLRRPRRLQKISGLALALLGAAPAFAQTPDNSAEPARVIVTGSYIPTAETEGPLPVSVYTAQTLTKVGANTAAEGLRGQIPSYVGATATENDSNGGNGSAQVNLRALGAGNTLTLINGRRAFSLTDINAIPLGAISRSEVLKDGASAIYGSDAVAGVVNFVLLNGPGTQPLKGAEIDFLYGNTTDKDARVFQAYVNAGWANEKFSVAFSANWYDRGDIYSRDRPLSTTADVRRLGGGNTTSPTYNGRVGFSSGAATGSVTTRAQLIRATQLGYTGAGSQRVIINDTGLITSLATTRTFNQVAGDGFNFRAYTPAIPGQERWQYYGTADYKPFADGRLVFYGNVLAVETRQDNGLAPSPFTLTTGGTSAGGLLRFNQFNPFQGTLGPLTVGGVTQTPEQVAAGGIPGAILSQVRYRFTDELNNRRSGYDKKIYHWTAGFRGDIPIKGSNFISGFNYDFGVVYDESKQIRTDNGDANLALLLAQYFPVATATNGVATRLAAIASGQALANAIALNAQFGNTFNPFLGENAPRAGTAPIFSTTTGLQIGTAPYDNRAAVARARYTANVMDQTISTLYDGRIGATLFPNLPQGGISFNVGVEYRKERSKHDGDPNQVRDPGTGVSSVLGFNADANRSFRRNVYSAYGEVAIPIITPTMKVPLVYSFDVQAAIRFEQFNVYGQDPTVVNPITGIPNGPFLKETFDNGGTPRFTVRWQPIDQLTLRGSYGKSYASPSFTQLFSPRAANFPVISDPYAASLGLAATGQPSNGVFQQGNPVLFPEKTDTYTAGFVFTPKFVKGFTLTVDYYQLNTSSLIIDPASQAQVYASINAQSLLGRAPNTALGTFGITQDQFNSLAPVFFGVYRDTNGQILGINAGYGNTGKRYVQGIDIVGNYELPFDRFGKFTFTLGYNHFFTYKANTGAGIGNTNFLGKNLTSLPLTPGAVPYNKGFFRAEWEWRGFDFVANLNYVGDYLDDPSFISGNTQVAGNAANPIYFYNRKSREYVTLDLQLSYEFKRPAAAPGYSKDAKGARTQVASGDSGTFFQRLLWGTKLRVGVNNVADTPPPFDAGAFNDNYDTNTYSIRNRYWYVGINKKF